jgi:hypothetical protein
MITTLKIIKIIDFDTLVNTIHLIDKLGFDDATRTDSCRDYILTQYLVQISNYIFGFSSVMYFN